MRKVKVREASPKLNFASNNEKMKTFLPEASDPPAPGLLCLRGSLAVASRANDLPQDA